MTLITMAGNPSFVVQVADRRLTGASGPLSDEQTKAIHFRLPRAELLAGYTGLARIGTKEMNLELMELLWHSAVDGGYELDGTGRAVASRLTDLFRSPRVLRYRPHDRRLTLMMAGFHRLDDERHDVVYGFWTNFQDWGVGDASEAWDAFSFTPFTAKPRDEWPTFIQRIGAYDLLEPQDWDGILRPLLGKGKPPDAIRDKLLDMLPSQAARNPTVGEIANAAILLPNGSAQWSFHANEPRWDLCIGSTVNAIPGNGILAAELTIVPSDRDGGVDRSRLPMVVPRVPPQRPCPCGSGKRYRQCHGKTGRRKG